MPIELIVGSRFEQSARKLQKHYPNILKDLLNLRAILLAGQTPGNRIQGLPYRVYKVRSRNSDARKGKRGGYRVVYYLETETQVVLLMIYSKTERKDLPVEVIRHLIEEYERGR